MIIVIPGRPRPQARHRSYFHGTRCHYVDPSCRDKKLIRLSVEDYLHEFYPDFTFFENPRISCLFQFPYPKTNHHKRREMAKQGLVRHVGKPDVDNCLKLILDAFTGILYKDDKNASIGYCVKTYSDYPKSIISVEEVDPVVYPWELQPLFCNPNMVKAEVPFVYASKYANPDDLSDLITGIDDVVLKNLS